ncbi:MAG: hypothetical protein GX493_05785, partial [Firmicutes bacterium]|nr:hypothetical protein [Bacillota bacterium]
RKEVPISDEIEVKAEAWTTFQLPRGRKRHETGVPPAGGREFHLGRGGKIVKYAEENGMKLRSHTLVWHHQVPEWFFKDQEGRDMTQETDPAKRESGKGQTSNDYNPHPEAKKNAIWNLIQELWTEGIPVDGVGHQTYINIGWPDVNQIVDSIRFFGEKGFDNQVTELDVSIYTDSSSSYGSYQAIPAWVFTRQGERYRELFAGLKNLAGYFSNVTFWGMADDHTWLNQLTHQPTQRPVALRYLS